MDSYCQKRITNYQCCGHYYDVEFTFCEGDHPDTNAAKEACWESQPKKKRNLSTTIVTTDHNGGYCSRDCRAEISGWHCCTCQQPVKGQRNAENTLVHVVGDEEHEFCDSCTVGVWA